MSQFVHQSFEFVGVSVTVGMIKDLQETIDTAINPENNKILMVLFMIYLPGDNE